MFLQLCLAGRNSASFPLKLFFGAFYEPWTSKAWFQGSTFNLAVVVSASECIVTPAQSCLWPDNGKDNIKGLETMEFLWQGCRTASCHQWLNEFLSSPTVKGWSTRAGFFVFVPRESISIWMITFTCHQRASWVTLASLSDMYEALLTLSVEAGWTLDILCSCGLAVLFFYKLKLQNSVNDSGAFGKLLYI